MGASYGCLVWVNYMGKMRCIIDPSIESVVQNIYESKGPFNKPYQHSPGSQVHEKNIIQLSTHTSIRRVWHHRRMINGWYFWFSSTLHWESPGESIILIANWFEQAMWIWMGYMRLNGPPYALSSMHFLVVWLFALLTQLSSSLHTEKVNPLLCLASKKQFLVFVRYSPRQELWIPVDRVLLVAVWSSEYG